MKTLAKNKILALLLISLFGLFAADSAVAAVDMNPSDCPMKVHCGLCPVPASVDTLDGNLDFVPFYDVTIALPQFESIDPDSLYHPPKV